MAGDLAPESERVVDAELAALGIERRSKRRGINPMAWAFVAMATAFGAVSAWFLFSDKPQPVADAGPAETTAAPTPIHDPPPPPSVAAEPTGSAVEVDPIDMGQQSGSGTVGGPLQKGNDKPPTTEDKTQPKTIKPCSPDDPFCGTGTPDGPTAESKSGSSGESSAGLTQDQAQSVVSQYKGSLMRRCRSMVTKGGAKVFATITVGRSGAVQSASVSGGNEYPGLASCVRQRIMNWSFPASGGTTTLNVSFNFL
jgi:outer membrane biosynthesis protein TonB